MSSNYVNANVPKKKAPHQSQSTEKTIYIGVFFDGTANNKFQVMMGKLFRSKEAIDKNMTSINGEKMTISQVRSKGRKYWETNYPNALSRSQLDEIFFGYDMPKQGENQFFIEDSEHLADLVGQKGPVVDKGTGEVIQQMGTYHEARDAFKSKNKTNTMLDEEWKQMKKSEGGIASIQGSTYTNVAILEAVYKTDKDYYPIYVEGAGTDTDMSNGSMNLWGGATGRADSGVWAKVKKAAEAVTRITESFIWKSEISKLHIKMSTYGFSRGATEARMFSFVYDPKNNNEGVDKALSKIENKKFLKDPKIDKELNFVGVFDTVASVLNYDTDNLHLYGVDKADKVVHLCAMDEFREKFPLTDISSAYSNGLELFMPGCHTDVGGGTSLGVDDMKQIDSMKVTVSPVKNGGYVVDSIFGGNAQEGPEDVIYINKWNKNIPGDYAKVNIETFKTMGWIPSSALPNYLRSRNVSEESACETYGAVYENTPLSISIRKYVKPGYTNIALQLMKKAVDELSLMNTIPLSYIIKDKLLKELYNKWSGMIGFKGQKFTQLTNEQYQNLRSLYLHYSGQDSLGSHLVNGVRRERIAKYRLLITRQIFIGKKGNGSKFYLLSQRN